MARIDSLNNFLTDVAVAIKSKKGSDVDIPAANFDTEITNLPSGGTYQTKSITISSNGTQTVTPDTGYDAIEELSITTQVPLRPLQTKTYNVTQNASLRLLPDTGYDGFDEVTVNVNVPVTETQEEYNEQIRLAEEILGTIEDYTLLNYIETTGTQYINTDITIDSTAISQLTLEMEFMVKPGFSINYMRAFGASSGDYQLMMNNTTSNSWSCCGTSISSMSFSDFNTIKVVGASQIYYNDVLKATVTAPTINQMTLWIGRGYDRYSQIRIKRVKISNMNSVLRDLIPVMASNGTICMWDKVDKKYYTNAGTGVFNSGGVASE